MTCVAGFTRRAQDIKASYANPKGGSFPALALCIRRLYVKHRHTHNRRSRQRLNGTARGRCTFRLPIPQQPANGERLMAVAVFGEAMKCDGVKRLRQRRETSVLQRASRWRLYAFGALSDTTALADSEPQALGEVLFAKGAVVRWRR